MVSANVPRDTSLPLSPSTTAATDQYVQSVATTCAPFHGCPIAWNRPNDTEAYRTFRPCLRLGNGTDARPPRNCMRRFVVTRWENQRSCLRHGRLRETHCRL